MASRTLVDEIITLIQSQANNNPAPQLCEIVNNYEDKSYCDVKIDNLGKFNHVKTIGSVDIGLKGVLVFINGDLNNKVVISETVVEDINLDEIYNSLNNKANKNHSHNILDVNNLNNELNSKSEVNHGHAIANITGLIQALNNKANTEHNHDERYYTEAEVDGRISSLRTFTKLVVNASVDLYYNPFFVKINVHQLSNVGSGSLPMTYSHNIPQVYAPSYSLNVPLFNMKNGNPYGFMRLNSNGLLEIIINQVTYNTSGGTTMYGGFMYIR